MISLSALFGAAWAAALASFIVCMLIVVTQGWHGKHSLDNDITSVQKFHQKPVPRVGGVALVMGMLIALALMYLDTPRWMGEDGTDDIFKLLLAALPAFCAGLAEDLTKRINVTTRLLATFCSSLLACWLLDAYLTRLDLWGIDEFLLFVPIALVVTSISVAGVANAVNIIDGFHGLAGGAVLIMLAGLGTLAWQAADAFVVQLALLGGAATLGFLLVNYPTGRIFLGDGGAYFLGFWLAEVAVLLIVRNPEVGTWQVLAVCAYPVIETLYSMYRKKVIRRMSPGLPDRLHFHMLVHRRVVRRLIGPAHAMPWLRNAMVAPLISSGVLIAALAAVLAGTSTPAAVGIVLLEAAFYMLVYRRMVSGQWHLAPTLSLGMWPLGRWLLSSVRFRDSDRRSRPLI
jgi:UDP-N-acetylmuramyl pentapeptide phosphotransferase/UDP-N-acetylglucosamine-1-phosphate transferase